jgi:hypothetical protein
MTARSRALASDPVAEEAAREFLSQGGSAVGSVLSGFFAAAGAYSGVLLGPVTVLVGAVGSGVRCFDGRLRQPGLGAKRPRGVPKDEGIPEAARVAVPGAVAAALVAHAYDGSQKLGTILRAGVRQAERCGAEARARLLGRIRGLGATALTETDFARNLLRVAGPSQGGLLTPADFAAPLDVDQPAIQRTLDGATIAEPPWSATPGPLAPESDLGLGAGVCAVDVAGVFAALCYRRVRDGFAVEELDLEAPLAAVPVQRGVTRVAPGSRLPAPTPVAIRLDGAGVPVEVLVAPAADRLEAAALATAPLHLVRDARTHSVQIVHASR